jgi:hypothetical protein
MFIPWISYTSLGSETSFKFQCVNEIDVVKGYSHSPLLIRCDRCEPNEESISSSSRAGNNNERGVWGSVEGAGKVRLFSCSAPRCCFKYFGHTHAVTQLPRFSQYCTLYRAFQWPRIKITDCTVITHSSVKIVRTWSIAAWSTGYICWTNTLRKCYSKQVMSSFGLTRVGRTQYVTPLQ